MEPVPPAVEAQSLNHWTARKSLSFILVLLLRSYSCEYLHTSPHLTFTKSQGTAPTGNLEATMGTPPLSDKDILMWRDEVSLPKLT